MQNIDFLYYNSTNNAWHFETALVKRSRNFEENVVKNMI